MIKVNLDGFDLRLLIEKKLESYYNKDSVEYKLYMLLYEDFIDNEDSIFDCGETLDTMLEYDVDGNYRIMGPDDEEYERFEKYITEKFNVDLENDYVTEIQEKLSGEEIESFGLFGNSSFMVEQVCKNFETGKLYYLCQEY